MKKRNIVTLAVSLTAGVILMVFLALLIFGRTVFACSSDNVLGLEKVSVRGHKITLEFDPNETMRKDSEPYGAMRKLFEQGKSKEYSVTFLMEGVENNYYSVDDVDVDSIGKTIRINAKGVQMSRVTGLRIRDGMEFYKVDFKNNTIEAAIVSVEGNGMYTITLSTYTQEYNPKTRTWSEPEVEQSTSTLWT